MVLFECWHCLYLGSICYLVLFKSWFYLFNGNVCSVNLKFFLFVCFCICLFNGFVLMFVLIFNTLFFSLCSLRYCSLGLFIGPVC